MLTAHSLVATRPDPAYRDAMKISRCFVALALLAMLLPAAIARAQESAALPPAPQPVDKPPLALYIVIVLVLAFASVLLSIMPSKRGHQD